MEAPNAAFYHQLFGLKKPRVNYYGRDFLDYGLMIAATAAVIAASYGLRSAVSIAGLVLCAVTLAMFAVRHGVELRVPLIARRPQDILYMFFYKLRNLRTPYFAALGVLLAENVLIAATPNLPHHTEWMRTAGLVLFYAHLLGITIYRTAILIAHLAKKGLVKEVLMQTPWKRVINERTNITFELIHAFCTGLLTHIVLIAPWFLVIRYARFSILLLPAVCFLNVLIHLKWLRTVNSWFYRDHWVGHNSELEFLFLHGTHHDAIPTALIAVAGNGFLEGFLRFALGSPLAFYNPILSAVFFTFDVKMDMELHQYIPGVFPFLTKSTLELGQHSTHHYGRLEPYGLGLKVDRPDVPEARKKAYSKMPAELMNSLQLDEELTGFEWDNPTHRSTLSLWDKYEKQEERAS